MMKILSERLLQRIIKNADSGCWEWKNLDVNGYGRIRTYHTKGKPKLAFAHKVSYQTFKGEVPKGYYVDQSCHNKRCINPEHLELSNKRKNHLKDSSFAIVNAKKDVCKYGHPFDETNTYYHSRTNQRQCKACKLERDRKYKASLAPEQIEESRRKSRERTAKWKAKNK